MFYQESGVRYFFVSVGETFWLSASGIVINLESVRPLLCRFPVAAVTNYYKVKTIQIYCLLAMDVRNLKSVLPGQSQGIPMFFLEVLGEPSIPLLFSLTIAQLVVLSPTKLITLIHHHIIFSNSNPSCIPFIRNIVIKSGPLG